MNIFVAKINYSTSAASLQDLFESYGEVDSAKIIMDKDTGRSKGFGFVEMPNDSEALEAISELNESEFEGSTIVVKKANPRSDDRRGGGGGGRDRGGYRGGGGGDRGGRDRRY